MIAAQVQSEAGAGEGAVLVRGKMAAGAGALMDHQGLVLGGGEGKPKQGDGEADRGGYAERKKSFSKHVALVVSERREAAGAAGTRGWSG